MKYIVSLIKSWTSSSDSQFTILHNSLTIQNVQWKRSTPKSIGSIPFVAREDSTSFWCNGLSGLRISNLQSSITNLQSSISNLLRSQSADIKENISFARSSEHSEWSQSSILHFWCLSFNSSIHTQQNVPSHIRSHWNFFATILLLLLLQIQSLSPMSLNSSTLSDTRSSQTPFPPSIFFATFDQSRSGYHSETIDQTLLTKFDRVIPIIKSTFPLPSSASRMRDWAPKNLASFDDFRKWVCELPFPATDWAYSDSTS